MAKQLIVGAEAIKAKGWFGAYKWLILRRISQLSILGLFLLPVLPGRLSESTGGFFASFWNSLLDQWPSLEGMWVVKGNLAASMTLDVLPLTDPHILLQAIFAGVEPHRDAIIGVIIVIGFYLLVSGRVYCSWVCPVNMVTDAASWLRRKLGIKSSARITRSTRYWMLGLTLVLPLVTGSIVWELFNPVSMLFRGIVFGLGTAWVLVLSVFLFDLLVSKDGWCGRLCPVGAFYSLLGTKSPLRVVATKREACDDCMDCFAVCPEAQVIKPALKGESKGIGPVILSSNCTNCGRCIDVCAKDVFNFGSRFSGVEMNKVSGTAGQQHNPG
ncbi:MAG: quinol dehydrogenase ferredoxin subunit NapH [Sedimenticola sp.]|jgi:ferredoxin-type protein NapH|nr:MAG: quinol dehydrogenase ferredoxin subunit NapH [Sedimenticola sp.]